MIGISTATGFVREIITGRTFGATSQTDAFFAAFAVVSFCYFFFSGGALQGAVMPAYQSRLEAGQAGTAAGLLRWSGCVLIVISSIITVGLYLSAETIINFLYSGFSPATKQLTSSNLRILAPLVMFASLGSLAQTILHSKQRFILPATIPILINLVVMMSLIILGALYGVSALSIGYTFGNVFWIILLIPPIVVYFQNSIPSKSEDRHIVVSTFAILGALIIFDQLSGILQRSLLSEFEPGLISAFTYGTRIAGIPVGLIAGALSIVLFPRLVTATSGETRFRQPNIVQLGILNTVAIIFPATVFVFNEASFIVQLIFASRAFSSDAIQNTTSVLTVYSLSMPAHALILCLTKMYIAARHNRSMVLISVIAGVIQIALTYLMVGAYGWRGVPLATLVYAYCHVFLLIIVLSSFCDLNIAALLKSVAKIILSGTLASLIWFVPFGKGAYALFLYGASCILIYVCLLHIFGEKSVWNLFAREAPQS